MRAPIDSYRRRALWLAVAGLAVGRLAWANLPEPAPSAPGSPAASPPLKPYDMIVPPVPGDAGIVRLFFSYDCPYCRRYHNGLVQWGRTLPAPLRFVSMPVITSPENDNLTLAVYGRLIAEALDPQVVPSYDLAIYGLLQGDELRQTQPVSELLTTQVLGALVDAGLAPERITAFIDSEAMGQVEARVPDHGKVVVTYGIKATPSVAIAGRFLVNPDHTNGNASQFLGLLNGIVSRTIEGGARGL